MRRPPPSQRWDADLSVEERRVEIMRSLTDVLRERHLSALTMQDIADRLGMAKGNLYNYFSSKQDILYQCHVRAMEDSFRVLDEVARIEGAPDERIRALMAGLVRSVIEDPYGAVLTTDLDSLSPQQRRHYLSLRDRFEQGVRAVIADGVASGHFAVADVKLAAFALLGSVNWISRWYRPGGGKEPAEIAAAFADLFLAGLRSGSRAS